ncbi:MAG TPA: tetratricopeptide repeat protein [Opitutaceae bacterium]|nr:tetratricopeptide repeat protein [Opitutaceae bacterium]
MKRSTLPLLLALAIAAPGVAQDQVDSLFDMLRNRSIDQKQSARPGLDPKRIINESNSFLKEREPEMTAEEYALYEKVVTMITTNVAFALRMLEAMMDEKTPPSPAFEFILGNVHYAAGNVAESEKLYLSAVKRYPEFVRAWINLGVLYYTSSRYTEAIPCFSKAVVLGDRDPSTFGLLGFCLEKEGNVVSAEMAYMQALSGDPANSDWKEGLLRIYIDGKQFGRAESLVANLIKEKPTETRFWLTYSGVLLSQGRNIEAAVLLETSVGIGVAGPEEILLLGDLYADQDLVAEAVAMYEKVPVPDRDRGEEKLLRFAEVLIAAGKLADAEKTLASLAKAPTPRGNLALLQCRADLLVASKRWPEARAQAEALLQLAPLDGRALLTVGKTHAEEFDFPRALIAFEAAYRIPETAYRASIELAGLELKNRRYSKSVEYLEKALSIERTDTVEDYLARVKTLQARGPNSG